MTSVTFEPETRAPQDNPPSRHAALSARLSFMVIRLKEVYAYRTEVLVWLLNPALQLVLLATVWRAVYAGRTSVDGVTLTTMTSYVSLAAMHSLVSRDDVVNWVEKRVRTGVVAMDLLRPITLLEQVIWGQVAQLLMKGPMILIILPVAVGFSGITAPVALGPYLLSALLGWIVNSCIFLLLSSIAFWTLEMGGLTFLFFMVSGFLSGTLVPLWFMPDWLSAALAWLPMQATLFTPVAIYLGQIAGPDAWSAIGVQALWIVLLGGLALAVWRRAVRRVVVQGG